MLMVNLLDRTSGAPSKDMVQLQSLLKSMQPPPKTLTLFQILCWPNHQRVPNSTFALAQLMDTIEKWRNNVHSNNAPEDKVVVVSNDGYSRIGVYCVGKLVKDIINR